MPAKNLTRGLRRSVVVSRIVPRNIGYAVSRASKNLKNLRWFEVLETRGQIQGGKVSHYQVTIKVGFTLDDTMDPGA